MSPNSTGPEAPSKARRRNPLVSLFSVLGFMLTALLFSASAASATTPVLPDPGDVAVNIAQDGGSQLASVAVVVVPAIIAVLAIFWAIRTVMGKLGLGKAKI